MTSIDRVHGLTRERFVREYLAPRRPVAVSGAMDDWPALARWDFAFFRSLAAGAGADTEVEVEVGDCLREPTVRERWRFADYVAAIAEGRLPAAAPDRVPYLSVFPLFATFPQLRADVRQGLWPNRHVFHSAWIGPAGTFSGLHYDRYHGLLAQIRGRKRVVLYPPEQWERMYESRKFDRGTVVSQVDARRPEDDRFPRFREARGAEVLLEPGQMLFIPRGWPHHVLALEPSISLSCFGQTRRDLVLSEPRDFVRNTLHALGLYRRGDCTCHAGG